MILGLVISWGKGLKKDHILYLTVNLIQALLKKLVVLKENFILFDYHTETYDAVISSRRDILV